jgi:hypothetical protein
MTSSAAFRQDGKLLGAAAEERVGTDEESVGAVARHR